MRVDTKLKILFAVSMFVIMVGILLLIYLLPSTPRVGTAIGTQTIFVHPTEVAYIDSPSDLDFLTSGELVVSFPYTPCTSVTFGDNLGVLSWDKGIITFEGDMDASARIFFDYFLKPLIRDYIREELLK